MRRERMGTAVCAVVIALGGCVQAPPPGSAPAASRNAGLGDADVGVLAAVLAAADARRPDTVAIDAGLRSDVPIVRASAARAIGQIGVRARAATARALLTDPDSMVAADAAFALGSLRDTLAVDGLSAALSGPPTVATAAAWSLGELGEPARLALEAVIRAGQPARALSDVLQASTKLRPVPVALVVPHLQHADVAVRRSAAYALTRTRSPSAVRPLLAAARSLRPALPTRAPSTPDTAADFRSYIARGLALPAAGDSLSSDARAILRTLAGDPHPHVRINALRSLATYGRDARGDLMAHLRDGDANVRVAIAQVIGDALDSTRADWAAVWGADTGLTFRRSLLAPALRNGVRLPALEPNGAESWLTHREWQYRSAAVQATTGARLADVDVVAARLLGDADGRVRSAAFAVVAPWADSAAAATKPYSRSALAAAIGDRDLYVRATILNALRQRARAADASLALAAWRNGANDHENDARVAALRVIVAAWRSDSASFSGELRAALASTRAPTDAAELTVGRAIAPLQHWPPPTRPERPLTWYADRVREYVNRDVIGRPVTATVSTTRGTVRVRFHGADAPLTVANFVELSRRRYFNGSVFHRVVPNFVAQDGDPRGDGSGGPGYAIRDELNRRWYDRGAVGMALSGPDTGGSQFFLTHSPQPHLDGHYTVFGHVIDGFAALDAVVQGDRIVSITIQ